MLITELAQAANLGSAWQTDSSFFGLAHRPVELLALATCRSLKTGSHECFMLPVNAVRFSQKKTKWIIVKWSDK